MQSVELNLDEKSYDICIDAGLLDDSALIRSKIKGDKVFIVTSESVGPLYLDRLQETLKGLKVDSIVLPDGEQTKNLDTIDLVVGELLAKRHNRGTTIIALGGGVIGDTAGFVAATYQRGVDFIQIPTTLLAQVDSSVGGKTAVNHPLGKNMIGAFYQPKAVYIDIDTLKTLPQRELSAGFSEVMKHGILADFEYFEWLEDQVDDLLNLEKDAIIHAIKRSCEIKASVVSADEKEQGVRALLNLGHTFGHAVETSEGYGTWLHGEAVGVGMVLAADLSLRMGRISSLDALRVKNLVEKFRLPVTLPKGSSSEVLFDLMSLDKKVTDGGIRFVLMDRIGKTSLVDNIAPELVKLTLESPELCVI
jgi:3-dehydroquinate synthase